MGTSASEIFDLRNFYFYQSGNNFIGSIKDFNYKIDPESEVFRIVTWHGKLNSECAKIENEKEFPFSQEGFDEMIKWLESIYKNEK